MGLVLVSMVYYTNGGFGREFDHRVVGLVISWSSTFMVTVEAGWSANVSSALSVRPLA